MHLPLSQLISHIKILSSRLVESNGHSSKPMCALKYPEIMGLSDSKLNHLIAMIVKLRGTLLFLMGTQIVAGASALTPGPFAFDNVLSLDISPQWRCIKHTVTFH